MGDESMAFFYYYAVIARRRVSRRGNLINDISVGKIASSLRSSQ